MGSPGFHPLKKPADWEKCLNEGCHANLLVPAYTGVRQASSAGLDGAATSSSLQCSTCSFLNDHLIRSDVSAVVGILVSNRPPCSPKLNCKLEVPTTIFMAFRRHVEPPSCANQ